MTFDEFENRILSVKDVKGVDFFSIGYSLLSSPIYACHIGNYFGNQIIVEGGIHAREYISSLLLVEQVKYLTSKQINGGIYFVFCSNPDGVKFVLNGVGDVKCKKLKDFLLNVNDGKTEFLQWKANANAVDLNVNFNALWGGGIHNLFCPYPENFVGYYADSEREVNALINFTNKVIPTATLSYHSKGEVIFYGFETLSASQIERDLALAREVQKETGYLPIKTENSTGGYSDWVSVNFGVPALTIEVGNALIPHPISEEYLPMIFEINKNVPLIALEFVNKSATTKKMRKSLNFLKRCF